MGQKAPGGTVKLSGREPEESMSSSDSLSDEEDVGESSGVVLGVWCRKSMGGCRVFFLSIAYSVRRSLGYGAGVVKPRNPPRWCCNPPRQPKQ